MNGFDLTPDRSRQPCDSDLESKEHELDINAHHGPTTQRPKGETLSSLGTHAGASQQSTIKKKKSRPRGRPGGNLRPRTQIRRHGGPTTPSAPLPLNIYPPPHLSSPRLHSTHNTPPSPQSQSIPSPPRLVAPRRLVPIPYLRCSRGMAGAGDDAGMDAVQKRLMFEDE